MSRLKHLRRNSDTSLLCKGRSRSPVKNLIHDLFQPNVESEREMMCRLEGSSVDSDATSFDPRLHLSAGEDEKEIRNNAFSPLSFHLDDDQVVENVHPKEDISLANLSEGGGGLENLHSSHLSPLDSGSFSPSIGENAKRHAASILNVGKPLFSRSFSLTSIPAEFPNEENEKVRIFSTFVFVWEEKIFNVVES